MDTIAPLAAEHGLSFAVAQPISGNRAQVIERFYPPEDVHVGVTVGSSFGPFDGALGKCILADMPPKEAEAVVRSRKIPAHTEQTITEAKALLAEVAEVRRSGWAASRQELNENNAVTATVIGPSGRAEAFLIALGFASQLTEEDIPGVGARLHDLARAISAEAGVPDAGSDGRGTAIRAASSAADKEKE